MDPVSGNEKWSVQPDTQPGGPGGEHTTEPEFTLSVVNHLQTRTYRVALQRRGSAVRFIGENGWYTKREVLAELDKVVAEWEIDPERDNIAVDRRFSGE